MVRRSSRRPKSPTAWHYRFPTTQAERRELEARCGTKCFGNVEDGRLLDPVCQYRARRGGAKHVTCDVDVQGCHAALARERLNRGRGDDATARHRLRNIRAKCEATLRAHEKEKAAATSDGHR